VKIKGAERQQLEKAFCLFLCQRINWFFCFFGASTLRMGFLEIISWSSA